MSPRGGTAKKMAGRRQLKREVVACLQGDLADNFAPLLVHPPQSLINPLFSAICHPVEIVRWHAVSAFGVVVARLVEENAEAARIVMRRFLWSLNDESGGIGWGAPESMGEIMVNNDLLRREYLHMLVSYTQEDGEEICQDGNFLELPMLQRGLLWGLGRVAGEFPADVGARLVEEDLFWYLGSPDRIVAALALRLCLLLGWNPGAEKLALFAGDKEVTIYIDRRMQSFAVEEMVRQLQPGAG